MIQALPISGKSPTLIASCLAIRNNRQLLASPPKAEKLPTAPPSPVLPFEPHKLTKLPC